MNIEDILAEWERKKKENLEKRERRGSPTCITADRSHVHGV